MPMRSSDSVLADDSLWTLTPAEKAKLYADLGYTARQVAQELARDELRAEFEAWLGSLPLEQRRKEQRDIPTAFRAWTLRLQATAS